MKSIILTALIFTCLINNIEASSSRVTDVVYLKDGSVINGVIIEQVPDQFIKVEMADGSVLVFKTDNIIRIIKSNLDTSTSSLSDRHLPNFSTSLFVGASIPVGDFGSASDDESGFAKPGFCFGVQTTMIKSDNLVIGFDGSYAINSIDKGDVRDYLELIPEIAISTSDYKTLNLMLLIGPGNDHGYFCALAGLSHFTNPKMVLTDGYDDITSEEATDLTFSYGGMVGVKNGNLSLNVRFITMEPELKAEVTINGAHFASETMRQRISILQIVVGINI